MADSRIFEAQHPARCPAGDAIVPGDRVHYVDDVLLHAGCTPPPDPTVPQRRVCGSCFMEVPVTGVCADCD